MEVLSVILSTLNDFFAAAAILVFLHCFYDSRYLWSGKKALFLFSVIALFYTVAAIVGLNELFLIPLIFIEVFGAIYDYRGKKLLGAIRFMLVLFLVLFCFYSITMLAEYYANSDLYAQIYNLPEDAEISVSLGNQVIFYLFTYLPFILFFGYIYFYLYYRVYKRGIIMKCGKRERIFVIVYPSAFIAATFLINPIDIGSRIPLIFSGCAIILFGALTPIFVYYTRISEYYQTRANRQEQYLEAELAHFQQYKQIQKETAQFRHDIRNNLLCVRDLLRSGKGDAAAEYVDDLLDVSDALRAKYVTGDEMLDCIIGVKADIMKKANISFQLDGVLAGGLKWKAMDVCVVFANALDNAIEACLQLPAQHRYIRMNIRNTPQFWFITIENPVKEDVDISRLFQKDGGFTTKPNASEHGIGAYNMLRTVENHGGVMKVTCESNRFCLEFTLNKA